MNLTIPWVLFLDELPMPRRPELLPGKEGRCREVFLRSLPVRDLDRPKLEEWLQGFGDVEDMRFLVDSASGELTGKAYVRYADKQGAIECLGACAGADAEGDDVAAAWSESERAPLYAEVGVNLVSYFQRIVEIYAPSCKVSVLGEIRETSDPEMERAERKQLHFAAVCGETQFAELRAVLAEALDNCHEEVAERLAAESLASGASLTPLPCATAESPILNGSVAATKPSFEDVGALPKRQGEVDSGVKLNSLAPKKRPRQCQSPGQAAARLDTFQAPVSAPRNSLPQPCERSPGMDGRLLSTAQGVHSGDTTSCNISSMERGLQCSWCASSCMVSSGRLEHVVIGRLDGTQQRRWRQGAGVVAFRGWPPSDSSGRGVQVCLVNGRKGSLGFPKGAAQHEAPLDCALREWHEETGLPVNRLRLLNSIVFVDSLFGCHYFVATWLPHDSDAGPAEASGELCWAPPCEDPHDPDPIVMAQWMDVRRALGHPHLSRPRKQLLAQAWRRFSSARPPGA